jgi:uncharacterized protein
VRAPSESPPAAAGTVLELYRWPVKSMAGERLGTLELTPDGARGDRAGAVFGPHKGSRRRLNAELVPRLLAWSAAGDGAAGPRVTAPGGERFGLGDPGLPDALAADLGREVEVRHSERGHQDVRGTVLVTVEAGRRAIEEALGRPLDIRRFRPNLHVALDAEPFAEQGWTGRRLRAGDVELEIVEPCDRCAVPTRDVDTQERWPELLKWIAAERDLFYGVRARAVVPGTVRAGDAVRVL